MTNNTQSEVIYLPLATDYVEDWGFWEGTREFLQNAEDADADCKVLIGNDSITILSNGTLERETLLLGASGKRGDDSAIGQHGEGYKLAMLVLTRLGHQVQIMTDGDIWAASIVEHPQLGVDCLAVTIAHNVYVSTGQVNVTISQVSNENITELRENYLPLSIEDRELIAENGGSQVLKFADGPKRVFVRGLYVCNLESTANYWFSYNFTPERISLDRDRQRVDSWSLRFHATQILVQAGKSELLAQMSEDEAEDISGSVGHLVDNYGTKELKQEISEAADKSFGSKYGEESVPINADWTIGKQLIQSDLARGKNLVPVAVTSRVFDSLSPTFVENRLPIVTSNEEAVSKQLTTALARFDGAMMEEQVTTFSAIRDDALIKGY